MRVALVLFPLFGGVFGSREKKDRVRSFGCEYAGRLFLWWRPVDFVVVVGFIVEKVRDSDSDGCADGWMEGIHWKGRALLEMRRLIIGIRWVSGLIGTVCIL